MNEITNRAFQTGIKKKATFLKYNKKFLKNLIVGDKLVKGVL